MIIVFSIKDKYLPGGDQCNEIQIYQNNNIIKCGNDTKYWKLESDDGIIYFTECLPDAEDQHEEVDERVRKKRKLLGINKEDAVLYFLHDHEVSKKYEEIGGGVKELSVEDWVHYHTSFEQILDNVFVFQHTSTFFSAIKKCNDTLSLFRVIKAFKND